MDDAPEQRSEETASSSPDFRAVFDAAPSALLVVAADPPRFTMLAVNPIHAWAFNTRPEALVGYGVFEVFPPDPDAQVREFMDNIRVSFETVVATGRSHEMPVKPYAVVAADGRTSEERYWSAVNAPVRDADGRIVQIVSSVRDVTGQVAERRAEEARALLMREVDHRARNALTVVQSIVRMTEAATIEDFKAIVTARVDTLARAQTSLARRRWEGADLQELVTQEMAALAPAEAFQVSGPPVLLQADQVQAMSMALHELATNAAKYGALSGAGGRVAVSWAVGEDGVLTVTWAESGGPPVVEPTRQGFGARLIDRLAQQMGGDAGFEWRPQGLVARLSLRI